MADDDIEDISMDTWVNQWNKGLNLVLVHQPDWDGMPFEYTVNRVVCAMTWLLNALDHPSLPDKQREFRAGLRRDIEKWAPILVPLHLKKLAEYQIDEARKQRKQAKAMAKRHRRPKP